MFEMFLDIKNVKKHFFYCICGQDTCISYSELSWRELCEQSNSIYTLVT